MRCAFLPDPPAAVVAATAPLVAGQIYKTTGGGGGKGYGLSFTNVPNASLSFSIWGSTNLALPLDQWDFLGHPAETSPGVYEFTDPLAADKAQQFYRVTSP